MNHRVCTECVDLPSKFQLGDIVRARGQTGMVSAVCFREAKVYYEVGGIMYESDDVMEPLSMVVSR